jgi:hypothetical protein
MVFAASALWPAEEGDEVAKKGLALAIWTAFKDYREQCQTLLVMLRAIDASE